MHSSIFSFDPSLGKKGREGYLKKCSGGYIEKYSDQLGDYIKLWKTRWFIMSTQGLIWLKNSESSQVLGYFIINPSHTRILLYDHIIKIISNSRILTLYAPTLRAASEWYIELKVYYQISDEIIKNPNISSFNINLNNEIIAYTSSSHYFSSLLYSLLNAQHEIMITSWKLSLDTLLSRQPYPFLNIYNILLYKANQGVKIYILLYKEINLVNNNNSILTKKLLANNKNIFVLRHSSSDNKNKKTFFSNPRNYFWSHHEKLFIIDRNNVFIGGIDVAHGRFDTISHQIIDEAGLLIPDHDYRQPAPKKFKPIHRGKNRKKNNAEFDQDLLIANKNEDEDEEIVETEDDNRSDSDISEDGYEDSDSNDELDYEIFIGGNTSNIPKASAVTLIEEDNKVNKVREEDDEDEIYEVQAVIVDDEESNDNKTLLSKAVPVNGASNVDFDDQISDEEREVALTTREIDALRENNQQEIGESSSFFATSSFADQNDTSSNLFVNPEDFPSNNTFVGTIKSMKNKLFSSTNSSIITSSSFFSTKFFSSSSSTTSKKKKKKSNFFSSSNSASHHLKYPRLGWHDLHCGISGSAARDAANHFIERWNHHRLVSNELSNPILFNTPTSDEFSNCAHCGKTKIGSGELKCPACNYKFMSVSKYCTKESPEKLPIRIDRYSYINYEITIRKDTLLFFKLFDGTEATNTFISTQNKINNNSPCIVSSLIYKNDNKDENKNDLSSSKAIEVTPLNDQDLEAETENEGNIHQIINNYEEYKRGEGVNSPQEGQIEPIYLDDPVSASPLTSPTTPIPLSSSSSSPFSQVIASKVLESSGSMSKELISLGLSPLVGDILMSVNGVNVLNCNKKKINKLILNIKHNKLNFKNLSSDYFNSRNNFLTGESDTITFSFRRHYINYNEIVKEEEQMLKKNKKNFFSSSPSASGLFSNQSFEVNGENCDIFIEKDDAVNSVKYDKGIEPELEIADQDFNLKVSNNNEEVKEEEFVGHLKKMIKVLEDIKTINNRIMLQNNRTTTTTNSSVITSNSSVITSSSSLPLPSPAPILPTSPQIVTPSTLPSPPIEAQLEAINENDLKGISSPPIEAQSYFTESTNISQTQISYSSSITTSSTFTSTTVTSEKTIENEEDYNIVKLEEYKESQIEIKDEEEEVNNGNYNENDENFIANLLKKSTIVFKSIINKSNSNQNKKNYKIIKNNSLLILLNYILKKELNFNLSYFFYVYSKQNELLNRMITNNGSCRVQFLRSIGDWSVGFNLRENSIENAYINLIHNSKHLVYIENQFFISSLPKYGVKNHIVDALVTRILRAYQHKEAFKVIIIIPLHPNGDFLSSLKSKIVMYYEYLTICRDQGSLFERLKREAPGINVSDYISFFSLKTYGILKKKIITEQIYIHDKLMIVDDRYVIIG